MDLSSKTEEDESLPNKDSALKNSLSDGVEKVSSEINQLKLNYNEKAANAYRTKIKSLLKKDFKNLNLNSVEKNSSSEKMVENENTAENEADNENEAEIKEEQIQKNFLSSELNTPNKQDSHTPILNQFNPELNELSLQLLDNNIQVLTDLISSKFKSLNELCSSRYEEIERLLESATFEITSELKTNLYNAIISYNFSALQHGFNPYLPSNYQFIQQPQLFYPYLNVDNPLTLNYNYNYDLGLGLGYQTFLQSQILNTTFPYSYQNFIPANLNTNLNFNFNPNPTHFIPNQNFQSKSIVDPVSEQNFSAPNSKSSISSKSHNLKLNITSLKKSDKLIEKCSKVFEEIEDDAETWFSSLSKKYVKAKMCYSGDCGCGKVHLQNCWSFFYCEKEKQDQKTDQQYIASFSTIQDFQKIFLNLKFCLQPQPCQALKIVRACKCELSLSLSDNGEESVYEKHIQTHHCKNEDFDECMLATPSTLYSFECEYDLAESINRQELIATALIGENFPEALQTSSAAYYLDSNNHDHFYIETDNPKHFKAMKSWVDALIDDKSTLFNRKDVQSPLNIVDKSIEGVKPKTASRFGRKNSRDSRPSTHKYESPRSTSNLEKSVSNQKPKHKSESKPRKLSKAQVESSPHRQEKSGDTLNSKKRNVKRKAKKQLRNKGSSSKHTHHQKSSKPNHSPNYKKLVYRKCSASPKKSE